ncbi:UDP-N-acetylmuramate--L-alanine ligase [Candidatus Berkelbacteria bacterium]|nr:UDP-N-acetylmuramate--L-alanine ligase [Candidatus Berkelbacteria bacterium]
MTYHLIGIEGSAMSGLAEILRAQGHTVTGSDLATTGHDAANVSGAERVVYTPAVREGSPGWVELAAGQAQGIPTLRADELLGELTAQATLVAVTGSHGKSSTTALLATMLDGAGRNPTVLLGAPVAAWGGKNYRIGDPTLWVLEADDYDRKFLTLTPQIAVITNIDREHLDVYADLVDIQAAFRAFVDRIRPGGTLVAHQDPSVDPVVTGLSADVKVVRYGTGTSYPSSLIPPLVTPGEHFRDNAAGALAAAEALGVERADALRALERFRGVGRRIECLGERGGVTVYDDYAHHPTEIQATLRALSAQYPNRRLIVAFQPHQHSRAKALFAEFSEAFTNADRVLLADVYAVPGRDETEHVDARDLAAAIGEHGVDVRYVGPLDALTAILDTELEPGDVFLTMGATAITTVGRTWVSGGDRGTTT